MIACLDVQYKGMLASAAGVLFRNWTDASAIDEKAIKVSPVEPYQPGQFYRRELPCLQAVLRTLPPVDTIVIDGYVWLDSKNKPGLGAHLYETLNEKVPVIGVAKTFFEGAEGTQELIRGKSNRPLYITAAGIDPAIATEQIRSMHGPYRIPTLLKRVDQLARSGLSSK